MQKWIITILYKDVKQKNKKTKKKIIWKNDVFFSCAYKTWITFDLTEKKKDRLNVCIVNVDTIKFRCSKYDQNSYLFLFSVQFCDPTQETQRINLAFDKSIQILITLFRRVSKRRGLGKVLSRNSKGHLVYTCFEIYY